MVSVVGLMRAGGFELGGLIFGFGCCVFGWSRTVGRRSMATLRCREWTGRIRSKRCLWITRDLVRLMACSR